MKSFTPLYPNTTNLCEDNVSMLQEILTSLKKAKNQGDWQELEQVEQKLETFVVRQKNTSIPNVLMVNLKDWQSDQTYHYQCNPFDQGPIFWSRPPEVKDRQRIKNENPKDAHRPQTICTNQESENFSKTKLLENLDSWVQKNLTPKQIEVLGGLHCGLSNKRIAKSMGIEEATVKAHLRTIYKIMGVRSRLQAINQLHKTSTKKSGLV